MATLVDPFLRWTTRPSTPDAFQVNSSPFWSVAEKSNMCWMGSLMK